MNQLLANIFFIMAIPMCTAWIFGFHFAFRKGEILGKPGETIRRNLPTWIVKPLIGCPMCMASVHGTFIFLLFLLGAYTHVWYWIAFVFAVCGLNFIVKVFLFGDSEPEFQELDHDEVSEIEFIVDYEDIDPEIRRYQKIIRSLYENYKTNRG